MISCRILALPLRAFRLALAGVAAQSNTGWWGRRLLSSNQLSAWVAPIGPAILGWTKLLPWREGGGRGGKGACVRLPRRRCHNLKAGRRGQSQQIPIEAKLRRGREEQLSLSPRSPPSCEQPSLDSIETHKGPCWQGTVDVCCVLPANLCRIMLIGAASGCEASAHTGMCLTKRRPCGKKDARAALFLSSLRLVYRVPLTQCTCRHPGGMNQ